MEVRKSAVVKISPLLSSKFSYSSTVVLCNEEGVELEGDQGSELYRIHIVLFARHW